MNALQLVQLIQTVNLLVLEIQKLGVTLGSPDLTDEELLEKLEANDAAMEKLRDED